MLRLCFLYRHICTYILVLGLRYVIRIQIPFGKGSSFSVAYRCHFDFPKSSVTTALQEALSKSNWNIYFATLDGHVSDFLSQKSENPLFWRLLLTDRRFSKCIFTHFIQQSYQEVQIQNRLTVGTSLVEKMTVKCLAQGLFKLYFSHRIKKCFSSPPVHIFTACPGIRTGNLLVLSSGL